MKALKSQKKRLTGSFPMLSVIVLQLGTNQRGKTIHNYITYH